MRKILEITADDFIKHGISANQLSTVGGLFWRAPGIDPFRIPGSFTGGLGETEIGAGTIAEPVNFFVQGLGASSFVTMYGNSGGVYRLNLATDVVTSLRSLTESAGQDMVLFRSELRYTRDSTLGKATSPDGDGPAFTDDYKQLSSSSPNHPLHVFQGNLYGGDKNIVFLEESASYSEAKLTLGDDLTIVDIDDDGTFLVIACVKKGGSSHTRVESRILFWDTISPNFNFEWEIHEGEITSISKTGSGRTLKAFAGSGIYLFSVGSSPEPFITSSTSTYAPFASADLQPARGGDGYCRGQQTWIANNRFWTYGKILPNSPAVFSNPYSNNVAYKAFYTNIFNQIYVSAADNNLYRFSATAQDATAETNIIKLPQPFNIKAIRINLVDALTASTSVQIRITNEDVGTAVIDETFTSTNSGSANRYLWRNVGPLRAEILRILIGVNDGATLRGVELWGDPIAVGPTQMGVT